MKKKDPREWMNNNHRQPSILMLPMSVKRKTEVIDKRCKVLVFVEHKWYTESLKMHLHQCGCKSMNWIGVC
jgi:hypothetical protein